jgi:hypothetical protein
MGLSSQLYFGTYVCCNRTSKQLSMTTRSCQTKNCSKFDLPVGYDILFCSHCGSQIADIADHINVETKVDTWAIDERIDGRFYIAPGDASYKHREATGEDIWLPNVAYSLGTEGLAALKPGQQSHGRWSCDNSFLIQEVDANQILFDMAAFEHEFLKEIEILKRYYGKDNVIIKWGLILTTR